MKRLNQVVKIGMILSILFCLGNTILTAQNTVVLKNMKTDRYILSAGDKFTGKAGDEGSWLKSPGIVGADKNYYGRAEWTVIRIGDSDLFQLKNTVTNRYLLCPGEPMKYKRQSEGSWLKSKKIVGSDGNYYNRAAWRITKHGNNGAYTIVNVKTDRMLLSTGQKPSKSEGGWLKSPELVGADANYYNRAVWFITGKGLSVIGKGSKPAVVSTLIKPTAVKPAPVVSTKGKVTFQNPTNDQIIEVYKGNGTMKPDFIKNINPRAKVTVDCKVGDIFTFKEYNGPNKGKPYSVTKTGAIHNVLIGKRYAESKNSYKRVSNADASRHTFDLLKIDPIYIDYKGDRAIRNHKKKIMGYGGMRKQIFASLKETDYDWTSIDGDIATKNHFSYKALNEEHTISEGEMFYSAKAFKKSYSGNIGVSGGGKGASAGGSASFSYTKSNSSSKKNIFTYTRMEVKVYDISLVKNKIDFTENFKRTIKALPKPSAIPSSKSSAKSKPEFAKYKKFVQEWGTHYPTKTAYGGVNIGVMTFTEDQMKEAEGYSIGVKGEAKKKVKGKAGFKYSQNKEFEEISSKSKNIFYCKGGQGAGDNWAADEGNAQPVDIQLSRIYELLKPEFFKDGTTERDLVGRRVMLKYAIEDYIGSATDEGRSLKPRLFRIKDVQWKMINEEDGSTTPAIFGHVKIQIKEKSSGKIVAKKTVFSRTHAAGLRVMAAKGYVESCSGVILFSVPTKNGKVDVNNYDFIINYKLTDYDKSSANDLIGEGSKSMNFSKALRPNTLKAELRSGEGDIDVSATVEEVVFDFDDFK